MYSSEWVKRKQALTGKAQTEATRQELRRCTASLAVPCVSVQLTHMQAQHTCKHKTPALVLWSAWSLSEGDTNMLRQTSEGVDCCIEGRWIEWNVFQSVQECTMGDQWEACLSYKAQTTKLD